MNALPIAVIGAGPVGLAAAAHILERGETPIVFEAGASVGANMLDWQHVRMFSPWEYTVDRASVRLLEQNGWQAPPLDELPTGGDMVERYMRPLADLMAEHIHLHARVVAVSRQNVDKMKDAGRDDAPFLLHVAYSDGEEALIQAKAVIDASGTWHQPNPLGASGMPAVGEKRHTDRIFYGIPQIDERYANKRVMVVGSGHSAINALLDLANNPTADVFWVMRTTNLQRVYGGGEDDGLPARGQLGQRIKDLVEQGRVQIVAPFHVREIREMGDGMEVIADEQSIIVDEIIATTGARPDLDMLRELRIDVDSSLESVRTLAPLIDPNIHSCGTVPPHGEAELRQPEQNFYIVGMKSYGRAPTFLLATGYEQVRSVVAGLVGDWQAARLCELYLPETGVCSTDFGDGGCCTPTANTISLDAIG